MKLLLAIAFALMAPALMTAAADRPPPVTALTFSPNGTQLLHNGVGQLHVRSAETGSEESVIAVGLGKISDIQFAPDGQLLAVSGGTPGESGAAILLDWTSRQRLATMGGFDDLANSVAFHPAGNLLAIGSADDSVIVYRLTAKQAPRRAFSLPGHSGPVFAVAFSPDGNRIVTASFDRTLRVWSAGDGGLIRTLTHHTEAIHCVVFRPMTGDWKTRPPYCASGGDDKTVRVWQPSIGRMVRIIRNHEGGILSLAWSSDGARLFSGGAEGIVRFFDGDSDELLGRWKAGDDWIYQLAVSPDGRRLATGDWSGTLRMWDITTRQSKPIW